MKHEQAVAAVDPAAVIADLHAALRPFQLVTDLDVVERYPPRRGRLGRVRHPAGGGAADQQW
jgi:hypothetical protein